MNGYSCFTALKWHLRNVVFRVSKICYVLFLRRLIILTTLMLFSCGLTERTLYVTLKTRHNCAVPKMLASLTQQRKHFVSTLFVKCCANQDN